MADEEQRKRKRNKRTAVSGTCYLPQVSSLSLLNL
jgi:hypothetical protein